MNGHFSNAIKTANKCIKRCSASWVMRLMGNANQNHTDTLPPAYQNNWNLKVREDPHSHLQKRRQAQQTQGRPGCAQSQLRVSGGPTGFWLVWLRSLLPPTLCSAGCKSNFENGRGCFGVLLWEAQDGDAFRGSGAASPWLPAEAPPAIRPWVFCPYEASAPTPSFLIRIQAGQRILLSP